VRSDGKSLGIDALSEVRSARSFLIQGDLTEADAGRAAEVLLCDGVVEEYRVKALPENGAAEPSACLNVLLHPGVTDSVAENAARALTELDLQVTAVATCRKYWLTGDLSDSEQTRVTSRVLANDAIEYVIAGPLQLEDLSLGSDYAYQLGTVPIRDMDSDERLMKLSAEGQLYLQLAEMQTIRDYFRSLDRDPTDIELETVAQTWSEHCSHKTLAVRIHFVETTGDEPARATQAHNTLNETILQPTDDLRTPRRPDGW